MSKVSKVVYCDLSISQDRARILEDSINEVLLEGFPAKGWELFAVNVTGPLEREIVFVRDKIDY